MVRNIVISVAVLGAICVAILPSSKTPLHHILFSSRGNDLRDLTLALWAYEDEQGSFPYASHENRGLLSWRVSLLPYLGHQELYDQIDKSVAWDHPNNVPFHDHMPDVFRDPASESCSQTSYRIVSGRGTGWIDSGKPLKVVDFKDGLINSIAFISVPNQETNWLDPTSLSIEYADHYIKFEYPNTCYSTFAGNTEYREPEDGWAGSPFLISDGE